MTAEEHLLEKDRQICCLYRRCKYDNSIKWSFRITRIKNNRLLEETGICLPIWRKKGNKMIMLAKMTKQYCYL
jgi:hypothetical protein